MIRQTMDYRRIYVGAILGLLFAGLTTAIGKLNGSSANPHPLLEPVKWTITVLLLPGLIGSMGVSNNVHAFSLAVAAFINGVVYFVVGWLLCAIFTRKRPPKIIAILVFSFLAGFAAQAQPSEAAARFAFGSF